MIGKEKERPGIGIKTSNLIRPLHSIVHHKGESFLSGIIGGMGTGNDLTTPHFSPVVPEFHARIESMCQKNKDQTPPPGSHQKNEFFITFNSGEEISKDVRNHQNLRNQDSSLNTNAVNEKPDHFHENQGNLFNNPHANSPKFFTAFDNSSNRSKNRKPVSGSQDEITRIINESDTINSRPKGAIKIRYPTNPAEKSDKSPFKIADENKEKNLFENLKTIGFNKLLSNELPTKSITISSPSQLPSNAEIAPPKVVKSRKPKKIC